MFRRQFWLWCLQRRRTGSPKSQVSRFFESHFRLLRRTRDTSHLELQFIALKISARTLGRALEAPVRVFLDDGGAVRICHRLTPGTRRHCCCAEVRASRRRPYRTRCRDYDPGFFHVLEEAETALSPAPFLVHLTRGTGPLRLALAGATRTGTAGVGSPDSRSASEAMPLPSRVNWRRQLIFRPMTITNHAASDRRRRTQ